MQNNKEITLECREVEVLSGVILKQQEVPEVSLCLSDFWWVFTYLNTKVKQPNQQSKALKPLSGAEKHSVGLK